MEQPKLSKDEVSASILLLGAAQGGVINNRSVAARMAELLFGSLLGSTELPANMALQIVDAGDRWSVRESIAGPAPQMSKVRDFQIVKIDAAIVPAEGPFAGDLLGDAAVAEKFAAAILENAAGTAELRRQAPLTVEDRGETWRIRGSANADRASEGPGPFELEVQKRDARVLDMKFEWVLETPPDVLEMLRASKAASKGLGGHGPDHRDE